MSSARPISLLICALGGEGGGVLTDWLVAAARVSNVPMQATSVPGVAQRTGATTYYLECMGTDAAGDAPVVFGLNPLPGCIDLLVSSELLETARQTSLGMISPQRTRVLTSTARALTVAERMRPGDGRMDSQALLDLVASQSREMHALDFGALAREARTIVSSVLLGAIAASGVLPLSRNACEAAIRGNDTGESASVAASLRGFALGWARVAEARQATPSAQALPGESTSDWAALFEPTAERVEAYQDAAYAALFRARVARVQQAEQSVALGAVAPGAIWQETMRWLALWMMHNDVVEVARLKSRRERWQQLAAQTGVQPGQLLKVQEFLKPGVPELAGLLPARLAQRLLAWDARRQRRGLPAWSQPIRLQTHTLRGMLALRALASLRWLRPWGQQHQQVQRDIDEWLGVLHTLMPVSAELALEVARLGRLIKGYGATHAHTQATFQHLLRAVAHNADLPVPQRIAALRAAQQAAQAQASPHALNTALGQHQAPPLSPPAQPIRFVPRRST